MVSEKLGHSSVAFTMDVYSHVVPGLQENAAQRFDQLILLESVEESDVGKPPKPGQVRNGEACWQWGDWVLGKCWETPPEKLT